MKRTRKEYKSDEIQKRDKSMRRHAKRKRKHKKHKKIKQKIQFVNKDTPILNSVIEYAHNNKKNYPKLLSALRPLETFVGATNLKESIARQIQYSIVTFAKKAPRRSKRIRRRLDSMEDDDTSSDGENTSEDTSDSDYELGEDTMDALQSAILKKQFIEMLFSIKDTSDGSGDEEEDEDGDNGFSNSINVLHTLLLGPPGTGKTTFASILVDVFAALKIVKRDKFFITQRSDWVGKYQGHSVGKAKKLIAKAKGGVIFIDEAYSIVAQQEHDMYGHEVLTTIVEAMTNPAKKVIFIFAGYAKDCQRLFQANAGLKRRFGYTYTFQKPTPSQLFQIMKLQCKKEKWKLDSSDKLRQVLLSSKDILTDGGGSTEKLVHFAKQAAVTLSFPDPPKKIITANILKEAIEILKCNSSLTKSSIVENMYI